MEVESMSGSKIDYLIKAEGNKVDGTQYSKIL